MPTSPRSTSKSKAAKPAAKMSMPRRNDDVIARLDRIAGALPATRRSMFGTVSWFLDANAQMFAGAWGDDVNVRVGEEEAVRLIAAGKAHAFEPMAGRPMREYVVVPASRLRDAELRRWIQRAADFAGTLPAKKGR